MVFLKKHEIIFLYTKSKDFKFSKYMSKIVGKI